MNALLLYQGTYRVSLPAVLSHGAGTVVAELGPLMAGAYTVDQVIIPAAGEIPTLTFALTAAKLLQAGDRLHLEAETT